CPPMASASAGASSLSGWISIGSSVDSGPIGTMGGDSWAPARPAPRAANPPAASATADLRSRRRPLRDCRKRRGLDRWLGRWSVKRGSLFDVKYVLYEHTMQAIGPAWVVHHRLLDLTHGCPERGLFTYGTHTHPLPSRHRAAPRCRLPANPVLRHAGRPATIRDRDRIARVRSHPRVRSRHRRIESHTSRLARSLLQRGSLRGALRALLVHDRRRALPRVRQRR